jgi:hypothetical protein
VALEVVAAAAPVAVIGEFLHDLGTGGLGALVVGVQVLHGDIDTAGHRAADVQGHPEAEAIVWIDPSMTVPALRQHARDPRRPLTTLGITLG